MGNPDVVRANAIRALMRTDFYLVSSGKGGLVAQSLLAVPFFGFVLFKFAIPLKMDDPALLTERSGASLGKKSIWTP